MESAVAAVTLLTNNSWSTGNAKNPSSGDYRSHIDDGCGLRTIIFFKHLDRNHTGGGANLPRRRYVNHQAYRQPEWRHNREGHQRHRDLYAR